MFQCIVSCPLSLSLSFRVRHTWVMAFLNAMNSPVYDVEQDYAIVNNVVVGHYIYS
jgi:hypothetical protein